MTKQSRSMFPDARIFSESTFLTPQGNYVQTNFVDISGNIEVNGLCLAKASEPKHNLATWPTIRLSRPSVFRNRGEVLIRDEQEGRARTSMEQAEEFAPKEAVVVDARVRAINAGMQLGQTKMSVKSRLRSKKSNTSTQALTFGNDWMIYCTSMCPPEDEAAAWRETFPESYTSVAHIHRPSQFAQALGFAVSEHIGTRGKPQPFKSTFNGFKTIEYQRRTQMIVHGPMLYVEDPYRCIDEAMKEYRFAILQIDPEIGGVFDLPVSGMMRDCLQSVEYPDGMPDTGEAVLSSDDSPTSKPKKSNQVYTYGRKTLRRERSGWSVDELGKEHIKEEVVEETVTSPDELPDPFRADEEKRPDVIVFQQLGTKFWFVHEAYRGEETEHWRVKMISQKDVDEGAIGQIAPKPFDVPPELRYETLDQHPTNPRLILEMCLNPSVPKPPMPYEGFSQFSEAELDHILACGQSLAMAVDLLDSAEQAFAAGSAWYAHRFILDLVALFGPIVNSVCLIRDGVAVVVLDRAPKTEATAWATFSGVGAYSLYVDGGSVLESVAPGGTSRWGLLRSSIFADPLEKHGWVRKR